MAGMAYETVRCEACGKEMGGKKFCPHCGAPSAFQTASAGPDLAGPPIFTGPIVGPPAAQAPPIFTPIEASPLVAPGAGLPGPAQEIASPRKSKHTALIVVILVVVLLCAGGAVAAVLLLTWSSASIAINSPSTGSSVDGNLVTVKLAVTGGDKVARVDVFLDSEKLATVKSAPYQVKLSSINDGKHSLDARALDAGGAVLAKASTTFSSKGLTTKPPGDTGTQTGQDKSKQYKAALSGKINEASALNDMISKDAERVNTEVNFNARIVPTPLMAELRALTTSANSFVASVAALAPTDDMKDLQAQFATLCDYLRVRAGALLNGAEAVVNGSHYTTEFSAGGKAKTSFDAAWPQFLAACRSRGVPI